MAMIHHLLDGALTRPLPSGEQLRLVCEYRSTGNPAIERRLIESNLRLVVKIARQLDRAHGRCLEDLVQEGCLGLIEGIRRFDPSKGTRLSTYAAFWIRAYIMKYTMDNVRVVRVVRTRAERAAFFQGVVGAAEVSFDSAAGPDAAPIGETLADPAPAADWMLEMAELAYQAERSAAQLGRGLGGRDLTILRERVMAPEPAPRRVVATRVSLSTERVRQIEGALKTAIRTELGAEHLGVAA
jgi:RNA polymerase sigma-32 factor